MHVVIFTSILSFNFYVSSNLMGHVVKMLTVSSNVWIMYRYMPNSRTYEHNI